MILQEWISQSSIATKVNSEMQDAMG